MIVLDKIRAFFKWYGKGMGFLEAKPEAKVAKKKAVGPADTSEAPGKKVDGSSSK